MGSMREELLARAWSVFSVRGAGNTQASGREAPRQNSGERKTTNGNGNAQQDCSWAEEDIDGLQKARLSQLATVIEGEIIPRLMMAHRVTAEAWMPDASDVDASEPPTIDAAQIESFTEMVLSSDAEATRAFCDKMVQRGVETPQLLLSLLAPTARRLGEMWESDEADFTAVTVGLCQLQQIMRELSHEYDCHTEQILADRRVLLAPVPGEQHTFGMLMVGEFFRRAGWDVNGDCALSTPELLRMVGSEWYAIVGISVAYESMLPEVTRIIDEVRRASRNRNVGVMVGGRIFTQDPTLAGQVGADATAADAEGALHLAQEMLVRSSVKR
ncbi:MAG: cobalamin B12-binding domain-containing protein [Gammaproteobacteria bacterium]|nr:cobalamin B12-binding domain-containing protein [Gammaproteobacteria bacterium]